MKKILGLVASLTLIAGVCAAVLAYVNSVTREPIARMQAQKKVAAARAVLPAAAVAVAEETLAGGEAYYVGRDASGTPVGYAVRGASAKGYGGTIELMVGFEADRKTVVAYKTLVASETPGLGMKLNDPGFAGQFAGKDGTKLKVSKSAPKANEVQAITAATITSKAVCKAVADAAGKLR